MNEQLKLHQKDSGPESAPNELFDIFLDANREYPNSGPGIATLVGTALFSGPYDIRAYAASRLSPEQIARLAAKMPNDSAHEAVSKKRLAALWTQFQSYILLRALGFAELKLNKVPSVPHIVETYLFFGVFNNEKMSQMLAGYMEEQNSLRADLKYFFETMQKCLNSPEVQAAYATFRTRLLEKISRGKGSIAKEREKVRIIFSKMLVQKIKTDPAFNQKSFKKLHSVSGIHKYLGIG